MYKDSIGQEIKIGDIICYKERDSSTENIAGIIEFKNGKFGKKNLPVVSHPFNGQPDLIYAWHVKIAMQDNTRIDRNGNIKR